MNKMNYNYDEKKEKKKEYDTEENDKWKKDNAIKINALSSISERLLSWSIPSDIKKKEDNGISFEGDLKSNPHYRRCFQKIHMNKRRRCMSHNPYRVPFICRKSTYEEMFSSEPKKKKKKKKKKKQHYDPTRFYKKFILRFKKKRWLETHLYHAKRFRMINIFGYKLALMHYDKIQRRLYRFSKRKALIHDLSYVEIIEVSGTEERIINVLKKCTNAEQANMLTKKYTSGILLGKLFIYNELIENEKDVNEIDDMEKERRQQNFFNAKREFICPAYFLWCSRMRRPMPTANATVKKDKTKTKNKERKEKTKNTEGKEEIENKEGKEKTENKKGKEKIENKQRNEETKTRVGKRKKNKTNDERNLWVFVHPLCLADVMTVFQRPDSEIKIKHINNIGIYELFGPTSFETLMGILKIKNRNVKRKMEKIETYNFNYHNITLPYNFVISCYVILPKVIGPFLCNYKIDKDNFQKMYNERFLFEEKKNEEIKGNEKTKLLKKNKNVAKDRKENDHYEDAYDYLQKKNGRRILKRYQFSPYDNNILMNEKIKQQVIKKVRINKYEHIRSKKTRSIKLSIQKIYEKLKNVIPTYEEIKKERDALLFTKLNKSGNAKEDDSMKRENRFVKKRRKKSKIKWDQLKNIKNIQRNIKIKFSVDSNERKKENLKSDSKEDIIEIPSLYKNVIEEHKKNERNEQEKNTRLIETYKSIKFNTHNDENKYEEEIKNSKDAILDKLSKEAKEIQQCVSQYLQEEETEKSKKDGKNDAVEENKNRTLYRQELCNIKENILNNVKEYIKIPILIINKTIGNNARYFILCPLRKKSCNLFFLLIRNGCLCIGLHEREKVLQNRNLICFPKDFPDSPGGISYNKIREEAAKRVYLRKPLNNKLNYRCLAINNPFNYSWDCIYPYKENVKIIRITDPYIQFQIQIFLKSFLAISLKHLNMISTIEEFKQFVKNVKSTFSVFANYFITVYVTPYNKSIPKRLSHICALSFRSTFKFLYKMNDSKKLCDWVKHTKKSAEREPVHNFLNLKEPLIRKYRNRKYRNANNNHKKKLQKEEERIIECQQKQEKKEIVSVDENKEFILPSKKLFGYVTSGGHLLSKGHGFGVGHISFYFFLENLLQHLFSLKLLSTSPLIINQNAKSFPFIALIRNVNSLYYHPVWLRLITEDKYMPF